MVLDQSALHICSSGPKFWFYFVILILSGVLYFPAWYRQWSLFTPCFFSIPDNQFYVLHDKYVGHGGHRPLLFGGLPKIKKFVPQFFVNTGSYRARNFKTLLLQFSSGLSQTLLGYFLPWPVEYRLFVGRVKRVKLVNSLSWELYV